MNWNIWYYVEKYPFETAVFIVLCIVAYLGYIELSKFWHKPLYIYGKGNWRIKRYVGRVIKIKDGRKFYAKTSETKLFEAIIKISGQPRRKIILDREDLDSLKPNKIIMNKKYILWNQKENAYILTNIPVGSYLLDSENIMKLDYNMIDQIDQKATRSARASPKLIHTVFSMHNIPLDDYEPEEDIVIRTGEDIYDIEKVGDYGSYLDLEKRIIKEQEKNKAENEEEGEKEEIKRANLKD